MDDGIRIRLTRRKSDRSMTGVDRKFVALSPIVAAPVGQAEVSTIIHDRFAHGEKPHTMSVGPGARHECKWIAYKILRAALDKGGQNVNVGVAIDSRGSREAVGLQVRTKRTAGESET